MRQCIRAAVCLLLFFVLCALGFGQVTLTASTSISTPSALTAGSFVRVTLAPGPNTLALDVSGAYTGQLVVCLSYAGSSGPLRTLPGALISDCINAGSTGIPANGQGAWSTRVSGPGYAYVAATSLTGAGPSVFLSGGAGGGSLSASDAVTSTKLNGGLPGALASGGLKTNGATILASYSGGGEASNTVTSSAAALTLSGGSDPASPIFVIVTNAGTVDAWASPVSGGHTWIIPAGSTVYLPVGGTALYGLSSGANTTLYCIKAGY